MIELIDENTIIEKLTDIYEKNILFIKRNDIERTFKINRIFG